MRGKPSSLTAMGTAAERAMEMERPTDERICSDPFARKFLPAWFYTFMKYISATDYAQQQATGDLGFIVARSRYMDDVLTEALDQGIQQLVILGAGFDSRAYRFDRLKTGVKVFEVDHPTTQKNKRKKLDRILGPKGIPNHVVFVPVDFTRDSLAARLLGNGYMEQSKTLFIWEGVTMYLDETSVKSTLVFVAEHSAPWQCDHLRLYVPTACAAEMGFGDTVCFFSQALLQGGTGLPGRNKSDRAIPGRVWFSPGTDDHCLRASGTLFYRQKCRAESNLRLCHCDWGCLILRKIRRGSSRHALIGLMVKPFIPKAPLWALIAACEVPDLLFFGFQAAGVEDQAATKLDFAHGLQ